MAESIFVFNNNVYITGQNNGFACYWINKKLKYLEEVNSMSFGIFVKANNNK